MKIHRYNLILSLLFFPCIRASVEQPSSHFIKATAYHKKRIAGGAIREKSRSKTLKALVGTLLAATCGLGIYRVWQLESQPAEANEAKKLKENLSGGKPIDLLNKEAGAESVQASLKKADIKVQERGDPQKAKALKKQQEARRRKEKKERKQPEEAENLKNQQEEATSELEGAVEQEDRTTIKPNKENRASQPITEIREGNKDPKDNEPRKDEREQRDGAEALVLNDEDDQKAEELPKTDTGDGTQTNKQSSATAVSQGETRTNSPKAESDPFFIP